MSIPLLTSPQQALLKALQENTEGGSVRTPDGTLWGQVYLDNIEVPGLSPAQTTTKTTLRSNTMSRFSLVLRTCLPDLTSFNGFQWADVGGITVAPDWNTQKKCGNGLHGWLFGAGDYSCSNYLDEDATWMVLEVVTDDIIMLDGKCKFPSAKTVFVGGRKEAAEYLLANEPRSSNVEIIGRIAGVGDRQSLIGGAMSVLTGGDHSTLTGGNCSTLTGGDHSILTGGEDSILTGGNCSTLTGGSYSTLTGGSYSTLTGGEDSILTGGSYSTLTGGSYSTLTGGYRSTLTGGNCSTLTGGSYSTLTGDDHSILTGGSYSTLTGGNCSTLTGGEDSELLFRYWDNDAKRTRTVIAYVGENGIKPGVAYTLDPDHKIIEA